MAAAQGTTTDDTWGQPNAGSFLDPATSHPGHPFEDRASLLNSSPAAKADVEDKPPSPAADPSEANDGEHFKAWLARDRYLLLHKCIYFVGMGANGAYYPYIVMRFASLGILGFQAGAILAGSHIAGLFSAPLLSSYADRSEQGRRTVLVGGALMGAVLMYCMRFASVWWHALLVQVSAEAVTSSTWPIVDASLMALLEANYGDKSAYGNSRAFGAAGWGINAAISGVIYDRYGLSAMFNTYLFMILPLFLLLWLMPVERRQATHESFQGAWRRLATVDVAVFLFVVFILSALLFVVDTFRTPYLSFLGASNTLLGLSVTMTAVSEAPCFFLAAAVLKRVSMPTVLLSVLVAYGVRFVWYATLTDPIYTMPMELLHGVQYAFGWAASTTYVSSLLPPELSSSAQGLLAAVQWGVGSAFGSLAGGYVYDKMGGRALMWDCAGLAMLGVGVMLLSMWRTRRIGTGKGDEKETAVHSP